MLAAIHADAFFMDRPLAERDPSYKQIIPYVTVCRNDLILMIRRKKKQNETRLHDLYSIGQGGHINPLQGLHGKKLIQAELQRELLEEIALGPDQYVLAPGGIINDDRTEVGSVHLGLWYTAETSSEEFRTNEPDKIEGSWVHRREVLEKYATLETWSQIVSDSLLREERPCPGKIA
jgi:predicted NUDIX family phosphoesterase